MRIATTLLAGGLVLCTAVAGCTSSSSTAPTSATSAPTSSPGSPAAESSAPGSSAAPTGTPVAPATLASSLQKALANETSVHLTLSTAVAGGSTIRGSGDVTLHAGTISRADITEALPGGLGSVRLVLVGGKTYAKLPAGFVPKATPWALVSTSSTQPLIAQLASTIDSVLSVASPATVVTLVRAASSVRDLGDGTVDGATARRYRVVIDSSRLPAGLSAGSARSVPIEVDTDRSGRPVELQGSLELSGARVTPTVTLSAYGTAVSITAPPASQVSS